MDSNKIILSLNTVSTTFSYFVAKNFQLIDLEVEICIL